MKKEIKLTEYIKEGGKLSNVDWSKAKSSYSDKNRFKKIISCEDKGDKGGQDIPCFWFEFEDGTEHRYAISWIYLTVDVVLAEPYFV